jgi:DNA-binding NtrC family response regulator
MSNKTIVYGEIVSPKDQRKIRQDCSAYSDRFLWQNDARPVENVKESATVFVDLDNPIFSTPDFLASIATSGKDIKIVGKLNEPNLDEAIKVAKLGVSEILNPDQCLQRLHELMEKLEKRKTGSSPKSSKYSGESLVGKSPEIMEITKMVDLLSDVDFPSALILGETGAGKSFISKILHNTGLRADHNLVEVNCSAIPDELFESELFGHVKGAFTDARSEKMGLFEYAQSGTLFLDEVGSLSASAQAKLLNILEDKKLRKVGDVNEKDINVRVVAATNLDLEKAIADGKFREDLFFRLNLLVIQIPPLRDRKEDLPALADHYLRLYSTLYSYPDIAISESALDAMQQHSWPGNVRELCNVIERAVLLSKGVIIEAKDVETAFKKGRLTIQDRRQIVIDFPPQGMSLSEIEQSIIKQVLNACNWNKTEAAKLLKISRPRLRRILENAGVEQNRRQ